MYVIVPLITAIHRNRHTLNY